MTHPLLITLLSLAFISTEDQGLPDRIAAYVTNELPFLVEFYKERHANPEISLEEKHTSRALADAARDAGFEVTENVGGYGIVAVYRNGDGPTILYRTDMDALPMYEKTGLEYASEQEIQYQGVTTGTMHSCGHDIHMTTWLGTARAMIAMKDQWSGTLLLIGQPAEEIGAGAQMMLDAGLFDTFGVPDYGVALHSSPTIPAGQIGLGKGYVLANTESVDIIVKGVGAHGASPHQSIDPVVIASMMVMDLQTIVSRNVDPLESAVVTVGAIQGGVKHNIIPDEVTLKLTVRTFSDETRELVHRRIREVARGTAIAAGLPEELMPEVIIPEEYTPANFNDHALVDAISASAAKAIGRTNVLDAPPQMVGEDFALYGSTEEDVPTVMMWLGTVTQEKVEKGNLPGLHSPYYYPEPEESIRTGVSVMTQSLIDIFNGSVE